jgi:spore coat polysaccharide biosynthesis protein SpsF (cytidylyltransferase family)
MASTRLPGKVLKKVCGKELLRIHLDRLRDCKNISEIIVATTVNSGDDIILKYVENWQYKVFRGLEEDVLDRYYQAAKDYQPGWVVRVTSDCPLVDPNLVDRVIEFAQKNDVDYCSNTLIEQFPDGQDVEVFTFNALERAWKESKKLSEREHVTQYIKNNSNFFGHNSFNAINYPAPADYSDIRMTVDEDRDILLVELLVSKLGFGKSWIEYTDYIIEHKLFDINKGIIRNEGLLKSLMKD